MRNRIIFSIIFKLCIGLNLPLTSLAENGKQAIGDEALRAWAGFKVTRQGSDEFKKEFIKRTEKIKNICRSMQGLQPGNGMATMIAVSQCSSLEQTFIEASTYQQTCEALHGKLTEAKKSFDEGSVELQDELDKKLADIKNLVENREKYSDRNIAKDALKNNRIERQKEINAFAEQIEINRLAIEKGWNNLKSRTADVLDDIQRASGRLNERKQKFAIGSLRADERGVGCADKAAMLQTNAQFTDSLHREVVFIEEQLKKQMQTLRETEKELQAHMQKLEPRKDNGRSHKKNKIARRKGQKNSVAKNNSDAGDGNSAGKDLREVVAGKGGTNGAEFSEVEAPSGASRMLDRRALPANSRSKTQPQARVVNNRDRASNSNLINYDIDAIF